MGGVSEIEEREHHENRDDEGDQTLPVILKKESDHLRMLEYSKDQEDKLWGIITILMLRTAAQMLPGLPAYVMFGLNSRKTPMTSRCSTASAAST